MEKHLHLAIRLIYRKLLFVYTLLINTFLQLNCFWKENNCAEVWLEFGACATMGLLLFLCFGFCSILIKLYLPRIDLYYMNFDDEQPVCYLELGYPLVGVDLNSRIFLIFFFSIPCF